MYRPYHGAQEASGFCAQAFVDDRIDFLLKAKRFSQKARWFVSFRRIIEDSNVDAGGFMCLDKSSLDGFLIIDS